MSCTLYHPTAAAIAQHCVILAVRSDARTPYPRRDFGKALGLGTLALTSNGLPQPSARKPNVVFILADDLGWRDTRVYGSKLYDTPNIDRLAQRGMRFTNAYAAAPICSPTR